MSTITLPLADLYTPIRGDLRIVEQIFDDELACDLDFINDMCDRVRSYRGKMLRPALLLLSARACGDLSPAHHTLAAVVEMVHMATLVHDDVLDEADERRRQPTVNTINGNVAAVLLGDFLVSHAFHLCSGPSTRQAAQKIGATASTVCQGELLQNYHRGADRLTEADYLDIIRRKTGALTATSCELGARYAGADETVIIGMHAYGLSAGTAFQIVDDILDVIGSPGMIGKTIGRDLAMGKPTLPTIHCLRKATRQTAASLREVLAGDVPYDRRRLREWLDETGSIDYAASVAADLVSDARRQLDMLPPSDARSCLDALAEFIVHRRF